MKKLTLILACLIGVFVLSSCSDTETYAEQKEKERDCINNYIADQGIKVISESQFLEQDTTTNLDNNEYVLFETTGVYMQIIRRGCGKMIQSGETTNVLCRFSEWNLMEDTLQATNNVMYYSPTPDIMSVTNTSGTFSASFDANSSVMYSYYGSTSVPSGWLVPLKYIKVGRVEKEGDEIAKVRLIVPHSQGQQYASANVYPCLYEITYERQN